MILLGPGIEAGREAHVIIETKRGKSLGAKTYSRQAVEDTRIPGAAGGLHPD
ncbi:MAG: hypothetical protein GX581_11060 [Syntrophomonadaceae bacterium]|nr:hypothetical protein [Syntrophomonadaceae bacterium]